MASIMIKTLSTAALLMFLALSTVLGQNYEHNRTTVGQVSDGVTTQRNIVIPQVVTISSNMRPIVKAIARLRVFQHEELPHISDAGLMQAQNVILEALLADSCDWLKLERVVEPTSTCELAEMKNLLALLDLFEVSIQAYNELNALDNGHGHPSCYCSWVKENVLDNCTNTDLLSTVQQTPGLRDCHNLCTPEENVGSLGDCLSHQ